MIEESKKVLKEVAVFVEKLNETNSSNEKLEILKELDSPVIRKVLYYVYNPYFNYWITSKSCEKLFEDNVTASSIGLFDLLDDLRNRKYTGHDAIHKFNSFVKEHIEYKELLYNILDGDLKTRTGVTQMNKVYSKCIPTFKVCLAQKLTDKLIEKTDFCYKWLISRKLDGLRCVIKFDDNQWKAYSRSGKVFSTLDNLTNYFESNFTDFKDYVFDGEICIVDEDDKEDFNAIAKEYNRKNHTIENPRFVMFDMIHKSEFDNESGDSTFFERYDMIINNIQTSKYITVLEQFPYTEQLFVEKKQEVEAEGFEGLMLRNGNAPYKAGRSNDLLKVKKFHDAEYTIVNATDGPFRTISKETGLEEEIECLSNITIELPSGDTVNVGSGFSLEERKMYYNKPEILVGKIATVQYFEKIKTDGKDSLRFPTIKNIFENGRDN